MVVVSGGRRSRPGRSRRGPRARRRRSRAARRWSASRPGAPNATWPWLRHSTRGHARACATSCVATSSARPSARSSAKTCSICAALGRSTPDSGSSSSSTGASCTSARAISTRWRWPPESVPKRACACSVEPDARERRVRPRPVLARHAPVPRRPPVGAHQRDVVRADREVQPRALGLRHVRRPPGQRHLAGPVRQLAQQRPEQRRLAAAVGPQHRGDLPRRDREVHAAEHVDAAHVPAAEVAGGDERAQPSTTLPT